jgi:hypothetical protein
MKVAFIMCVERGYLEDQTKLLCKSIRQYCGRYKDSSIYTFQPRKGTEIADETLAALKQLDVTHITENINADHPDYPIGNKIFVSAWAERNLDEDILVFVDSDSFFCNEPSAFELPEGIDAAVRPVDRKRKGSFGEGDFHDAYWQKLYEICGVTARPFVRTTLDNEEIRAYFNAGLMVCRRSANLYQLWEENFLKLMELGHVLVKEDGKTWVRNMDQFSLAATFSNNFQAIDILDERYNYPLPQRSHTKSSMGTAQLSELIHVHYHRWFNKPDFLHLVRPALDPNDEIFAWLEPQLPLDPVINDKLRSKGIETEELQRLREDAAKKNRNLWQRLMARLVPTGN